MNMPDTQTSELISSWVQWVQDHALSHYEFGWDAVIECCSEADLTRFVSEFVQRGGTESGLLAAAAARFRASPTIVQPGQWVVVSRDVDGTAVEAFHAESDARQRFSLMLGRPAPAEFTSPFSAVSDFGTHVSLHKT